jgi:thymidine kinase
MSGKLIFRYGTMGSGKSLQLLATAYNFEERSIPFLLLKSEIDDRDGEDVVHSRALGDKECVSIATDVDIYHLIVKFINQQIAMGLPKLKWLLVDECQFLTVKQVEELAAITDKFDISVICYGLRTDFKTKLFPASKRLFEIADSIDEIKSSCSCNKKTIFNARIDKNKNLITDGEQIEVGGDDKYISLCRKCYFEKINHKLYNNNNFN